MKSLRFVLLFLAPSFLITGASLPKDTAGVQTETLWRGVLRGDSLFSRAKWISVPFSASCFGSQGSNYEDTTSAQRKYLEYVVQDSRGRMASSDSIEWCCDELTANGTTWRDGVVITVAASVWGCEPAGFCHRQRYIYVPRRGRTARSEWTWFEWDPASKEPFLGTVTEGCIEYPMTLLPHVRKDSIVFEPALPPETKEGDLLERRLIDEMSVNCSRPGGPASPTMIDFFPTASSMTAQSLVVRDTDEIEILSAVVRAERTSKNALATKLFRLGIRAQGRQGFVTPASLKNVGFLGF